MQVRCDVRAVGLSTPDCEVIGAKWRRRVPPPRRLTTRESTLPWAILSFPWCFPRVNHPTLSLGIRARGIASSRVVNGGFFHVISRIATAAPSAGSLHDAGVAGMPLDAIELPLTVSNAVANRHNAIVSGNGFGPLSTKQLYRHPKSSRPHQPSTVDVPPLIRSANRR